MTLHYFSLIILTLLKVADVFVQDQVVYTELSSTASLPCGSTSRPFPSGVSRVYWYKGDDVTDITARILYYRFSDSFTRYFSDYSSPKHSCSSDRALSITDVLTGDQGTYICEAFGSVLDYTFTLNLEIAVSPSQPHLLLPSFQENTSTSIVCRVSAVKPGVGSVVFTVTVDPDFSIHSSDSDLSEGSADVTTGAVSVTYSSQISLQRKHNGQQAVCTVVWREKTVTSDSETVDVRFLASTITMTQSPSGPVSENTEVTFICVTDEAEPPADVVWSVDGNTRSSDSDSTEEGMYNTQNRRSVLTVRVDRTLNSKKVQCHVSGKSAVRYVKTVDVRFSASTITMTQSPSGPVSENTEVTFACVTDEAKPPADVMWSIGGYIRSSDSDSTEEGMYNTQKRRSVFFVRVDRTLNNKKVECHVSGKSAVKDTQTLDVTFLASTITMTQSPSGPVSENTEVTFICVTDEAEPTADVVWSVDGNTRSSDSDSTEKGMYNAQKRRSVLTVRVDRTLNNKKVECHVSGKSAVKDTRTLDVTYPPEVSVQSQSNVIQEGSQFVVNCQVVAGNPETLTTQYWEFEPKYHGSQSQALPGQREDRRLRIDRIVYSDAGTYRCTAGNTLGSNTGEIQIVVHYTPQLLETSESLIFFSELFQEVTLNLIVRAFPEFTDVQSAFMWYFVNKSVSFSSAEIQSTKLGSEVFQSLLHINNVGAKDYGVYIVTVNNGIGTPISFNIILNEKDEIADTPEAGSFNPGGIIVGVIVSVIVVAVVLIGIWMYRRKIKQNQSTDVKPQTSKDHMYADVNSFDSPSLGKNDNVYTQETCLTESTEQSNKTQVWNSDIGNYEDLINEGKQQKQVYEELKPVIHMKDMKQQLIKYKEEDLQILGLLHKGQYTNIDKGRLYSQSGEIDVAVKSVKVKVSASALQYLVNQMNCLEWIGPHRNIVEMFPLCQTGYLVNKLVTKYCHNGNLRMYLQSLHTKKEIYWQKIGLDIIDGLEFLEQQKPEILHFCLSAEHVLVDDTGSCRLTGFDFKHQVLQREWDQEEEGIYGAIEWKAPETIGDCKAHTKLSDVWAFGVLLHEIFTKGKDPYDGMTEDDIKTFIRDVQILSIPDECPRKIYTLMKKCWTYDAQNRPSFLIILPELRLLCNDAAETSRGKDMKSEYEPVNYSTDA